MESPETRFRLIVSRSRSRDRVNENTQNGEMVFSKNANRPRWCRLNRMLTGGIFVCLGCPHVWVRLMPPHRRVCAHKDPSLWRPKHENHRSWLRKHSTQHRFETVQLIRIIHNNISCLWCWADTSQPEYIKEMKIRIVRRRLIIKRLDPSVCQRIVFIFAHSFVV